MLIVNSERRQRNRLPRYNNVLTSQHFLNREQDPPPRLQTLDAQSLDFLHLEPPEDLVLLDLLVWTWRAWVVDDAVPKLMFWMVVVKALETNAVTRELLAVAAFKRLDTAVDTELASSWAFDQLAIVGNVTCAIQPKVNSLGSNSRWYDAPRRRATDSSLSDVISTKQM